MPRDNTGALPAMNEAESSPPPSAPSAVRAFVVPASLHGARLDKGIAQLLPELSRARVKRAIELGAVRVNGRRMPKGGTLSEGDAVRIDVAQVLDVPAVGSPGAPLKIVLETVHLVIVDKPAGQATAPIRPAEVGTLVNAVLGRFPELVPDGQDSFIGHSAREPGIIHRLDTETSGAVLVARTAAAFETLKAALRSGRLDKRYLLLCAGQGLPDEGIDRVPPDQPSEGPAAGLCLHSPARRHALRAAARGHALPRPPACGHLGPGRGFGRQGAAPSDPRALRRDRSPPGGG